VTGVAALCVETGGAYFGLDGVDPYDLCRNAFSFDYCLPVVAHPPCERWGRYWSGGPSAKVRRVLGADGGLFEFCLRAVRVCGGILEHPEASHAWGHHGIAKPPKQGGWVRADVFGWTCCVEQGHYGHRARKATWLYAVTASGLAPPDLIWGPSSGERLDEGFHSTEERRRARAAGKQPQKRLSKKECVATPTPFRDLLLSLARGQRRF
jgi:hypothetical protein